MGHVIEKGQYFFFRAKDIHSKGLVGGFDLLINPFVVIVIIWYYIPTLLKSIIIRRILMVEIHNLTTYKYEWIMDAAALLQEAFPHSWTDIDEAKDEIYQCLEKGKIALVAIENKHVIGFIGAMPNYGVSGWELHPLVVTPNYRGNGIGSRLMQVLEDSVRSRGGIMIYLGCDDEFGSTSLSHCDLYENTLEKISEIENHKNHPYEFYQKVGYKIVGVFPDANGIGKPDIWMAKRIYDKSTK